MRYVFALVGLRAQNIPVDEEKEFLLMYILQHYGTHSAAEVRMAFDMAVQGRLNLDPRDVKCYENFSIIYFASIMNSYRQWAAEQNRRLDRNLPPPAPTREELDRIDAEYLDFLFNQAFRKFQEIDLLPSTANRLRQWQKEK